MHWFVTVAGFEFVTLTTVPNQKSSLDTDDFLLLYTTTVFLTDNYPIKADLPTVYCTENLDKVVLSSFAVTVFQGFMKIDLLLPETCWICTPLVQNLKRYLC